MPGEKGNHQQNQCTALFSLTAIALCLLLLPHAQASLSVYSNESDYDAAVGAELFFIDFNGSTGSLVPGDSFSSDVAFGSPEASDPMMVFWTSDAITDAGSTSAPNGVGPVDGVFTTPVYAFALEFSSASKAETLSLYDADNDPIGAVTAPNPAGFFGVLSSVAIGSFEIDNGDFPDGNPDRFFVDDFRANIPEPATILLLGIGAGVALRSRR